MLESPRLKLRPIEPGDLDRLVEWRNRPEIWRNFFNTFPLSRNGQEAWYEKLIANPQQKMFAICLKGNAGAIGTLGLNHIDFPNQSCEFGNMLIGDEEQLGKGFATEASRTLIDYAFLRMNMNRIWLNVVADNAKARKLYERIGFRTEGILRESFFVDGSFHDVAVMACLRRDRAIRMPNSEISA